jgi:pimeloyl-ACP methyl ester carboxylesterase
MNASTRSYKVSTSHGLLAVEECGPANGFPVLLIHGNSTCRGVFQYQMQSKLAEKYRLIAIDLPGHGESSDAPDFMVTYTMSGLAGAVVELLEKIEINELVIFGWSLGGHIGIALLPRLPQLKGLMITGTPPIPRDGFAQGFKGSPQTGSASRQEMTIADAEAFTKHILKRTEPFLLEAVIRADGRFRKRVFEAAREGREVDQRVTVTESTIPLAVVNGGDDPIVNLDYFDTVPYGNLWQGKCQRLEGLGHAPFWEAPAVFNPVLESFLKDVAK